MTRCAKCGSRWHRLDEEGDRVCGMCGCVAVQREHEEPRDEPLDTVARVNQYVERRQSRTATLRVRRATRSRLARGT